MTDAQGPWDEIAKNHVVHEESYSFVERLQAMGAKPFCAMELEEARVQCEELTAQLSGQIDFDGEVREIVIPSPYSKEGIPTTIYKPSNCPETPIIFIYFHGGGLVLFSRKSYETCLQTIARDSGAIVLNVEYRLITETETPAAPFDDAVQVTKWVLDNREAVGGRNDSKVGVGGDSAGGQLAISVTNDVQGLDFQVLIYPNSDLSFEQPSCQKTIIYKPSNCPETPIIFIYFHGGGLVLFSRKSYETCLQTIARDSGAIVLNVEYRLITETETPAAPFDDAVQVTKWVLDNREAVGGRNDSKVGVGGDSAGGQLAISVTNDVQGLDFQVLIYPNSDLSFEQPSCQEFANCPGLSEKDVEWFSRHSLDRIPGHVTNPRINGMARTNTELSPPALVLLAEIDPVRDSGMAYAEKLRGAGVSVRIVIIEGVPHAFFGLPGHFKTKCEEAYGHVVQFITDFQ